MLWVVRFVDRRWACISISSMTSTIARFPRAGDYLTFVETFLLKNEPCVFPATVTSDWRARREWQKNGKPDLDYLGAEFGAARVPVADCREQQFDSHCKTEMKMSDYLCYWRSLVEGREREEGGGRGEEGRGGRAHMEEEGGRGEREQTQERDREKNEPPLLYLKDWHFFKQYPEYGAYTVPPFFTADWLNEVWDQREDVRDDYRFVYFGPMGTWTPFHADVFRSYSWSANVCGRKEWLLLPPGGEDRLRDECGRLPFDLRRSDLGLRCVKFIRVIQEAGEIIFVPRSGFIIFSLSSSRKKCVFVHFYHQVHNMEDAISINHNWVNGFGVYRMWRYMYSELQLVKREIADCREMDDWEKHCQVMLRACVGLDYLELLQTLCLVALPRLREVDSLLHTTAALASLSPLREAIARASSSRELSWFGHGRKAVEGEGRGEVEGEERGEVEGEGRGAVEREVREEKVVVVVDGLREVLRICDLSSGCVRGVRECVSEEEEKLLASVSDDLTRTLCTLRIFELSQISRIITELTADTDMKTILPHDMIFQ